jgi:hypothetical protein
MTAGPVLLHQAQRLPVVAVEIGETALVPAAALLGDSRRAGARRQGLVHELIHLVRALEAKDQDRLSARGRIGDALSRVHGERRLGEQHDLGVLADDHRRHVIGHAEEFKAQAGEERLRPPQVLDRKIDEQLGCHRGLLSLIAVLAERR